MQRISIALLALMLTGVSTAAIAPTAQAHVCAFEYGPTCSDAPCDSTDTHVHWGNRFLPCESVPTSTRLCFTHVCIAINRNLP